MAQDSRHRRVGTLQINRIVCGDSIFETRFAIVVKAQSSGTLVHANLILFLKELGMGSNVPLRLGP